eukprot:8831431-Alexandrium_andersonii.AAC.1
MDGDYMGHEGKGYGKPTNKQNKGSGKGGKQGGKGERQPKGEQRWRKSNESWAGRSHQNTRGASFWDSYVDDDLQQNIVGDQRGTVRSCLLYTSDAADDM